MLLLLMLTSTAKAQQVYMYDQPPNAEEIGRILFGPRTDEANISPSNPKLTRGINLSPKTPNPVTVMQGSVTERVGVSFPIEFGFNSFEINSNSKAYLDKVGEMLISQNYRNKRLIIEGHTDAKGSDGYNLYLSERRAHAVSDFLTKYYGISPTRFKVTGLGKSRSLTRDPYDGKNRRVEFYSASNE